MKFAMSGNFPYFFASSSRENPFYPPTGPGKFSWNDAYTRRSVQSEAEWLELRKWDPFNPYKSSEQFQQELKEEADTILRYYGTFLSWYIESPLFRNRDNLHYIMVSFITITKLLRNREGLHYIMVSYMKIRFCISAKLFVSVQSPECSGFFLKLYRVVLALRMDKIFEKL